MNYRVPFTITLVTLCLLSFIGCRNSIQPAQQTIVVGNSPLKDNYLLEEVRHGLHLIEINDSTQILLYRGVESCTMIQLK